MNEEIIRELYAMKRGGNRERFADVMRLLGDPQENFSAINIVGTNGKGSVAKMVYDALLLDGKITGIFTSPHLQNIRERIECCGKLISEKEFVRKYYEVKNTCGEMGFFEVMTAIMYLHFSDMDVEYGVLEAGLGGRLDPTGIAKQVCAAITSVSIDHENMLGKSIDEIAREKVAIAKNGCKLFAGHGIKKRMVAEKNAIICQEYEGEIGMEGPWQRTNAGVAFEMCKWLGLKENTVKNAIKNAKLHGRFERLGNAVLDVAKNVRGWKNVAKYVESLNEFDGAEVLFACKRGKERRISKECFPKNCCITLTTFPIESPPYSADPIKIANKIEGAKIENNALEAMKNALRNGRKIIVYGSFYLVGEASKMFYRIE